MFYDRTCSCRRPELAHQLPPHIKYIVCTEDNWPLQPKATATFPWREWHIRRPRECHCHMAETAFLRTHNDRAQSVGARRSVFLVLLDLSTAFDTIDHAVLLLRRRHQWRNTRVADVLPPRPNICDTLQERISAEFRKGRSSDRYCFNVNIAPLVKLFQLHHVQYHLVLTTHTCTSTSGQLSTQTRSYEWRLASET